MRISMSGKRFSGALLAAAMAVTATGVIAQETNGERKALRVVGGVDAPPNAYPWMAALVQAGISNAADGQFCGASLIRPDWVLTAAHCVQHAEAKEVEVLLGTNDLAGNGGERIAVQKIVVHPDFAEKEYPDVALLQLSKQSQQQPVKLVPEGSGLDTAGTVATAIGWGLTNGDDGNSASSKLQKVDVPIVSHAVCDKAYTGQGEQGIVETAMICAGFPEGGKDSCNGDSGGPLFVKGSDGEKFQQAGVVSFGSDAGCAARGIPGVYARVSTYNRWIDSQIGGGGTPAPEPDPSNPVAAKFSVDCQGLSCSFDASASTSDAPVQFYVWNFGDDAWEFGDKVTHAYKKADDYTVTLYMLLEDGRFVKTSNPVQVTGDGSTPPGDGGSDKTYTGSVNQEQGVVFLPEEGFSIEAGQLAGRLQGPKDADFDLFLEKLNAETNDWEVVAEASTKGANEELIYDAAAGTYDWVVVAIEGEGEFTLSTKHTSGGTKPPKSN